MKTMKIVLMLVAVLGLLATATPANAEDPEGGGPPACVTISTDSPGIIIDPACLPPITEPPQPITLP